MTQQVERLEALLTRVQENRAVPRARAAVQPTAAAAPAPKQPIAAAPAAAAKPVPAPVAPTRPVMQERDRGSVTEERVSLPGQRAPTRPVDAKEPARRPERERMSTPLEMAVEEELLANSPSEPPTGQWSTQARVPAGMAGKPVPTGPIATEPSFTVEPEPLREPARPIAQVVSKHATEIEATFGAMLKRSLGLRPR